AAISLCHDASESITFTIQEGLTSGLQAQSDALKCNCFSAPRKVRRISFLGVISLQAHPMSDRSSVTAQVE
ncbi:Uncharacterized protein DAT39_011659, partial [Clarias magur]